MCLPVNDADRPVDADSQAIALGPVKRAIAPGDVQLLHPLFQVFPGCLTLGRIDTIWARTNEQMAFKLTDAKFCGHYRSRAFVWICHVGDLTA